MRGLHAFCVSLTQVYRQFLPNTAQNPLAWFLLEILD
jgi:hypothetical protein